MRIGSIIEGRFRAPFFLCRCCSLLLGFGAITATGTVRADDSTFNLAMSGFVSTYALHSSQVGLSGQTRRTMDFRKATELLLSWDMAVHDNLTVGARLELLGDRADANSVQESYITAYGDWGRVIFGEEDGVASLLQVGAPTGDDRVDGMSPKIGTFAPDTLGGTIAYKHSDFGRSSKLTYVLPMMTGVTIGMSYIPSPSEGDLDGRQAARISNSAGTNVENAWEAAVRYNEDYGNLKIVAGLGASSAQQEVAETAEAHQTRINLGVVLDWSPLSAGLSYGTTNNGADDNNTRLLAIGINYELSPYTIGGSYLKRDNENATIDETNNRWTIGVIRSLGQGLTLRGAVQLQNARNLGGVASEQNGTLFTLGSQITF